MNAAHGAARGGRGRPDGYAFRLSADALLLAAEFGDLEPLCCPFFCFALEMGADSGPFWLAITGRDGVKAFLLAEFGVELGLADGR